MFPPIQARSGDELPYDGDLQRATKAQDRAAIRVIMAARNRAAGARDGWANEASAAAATRAASIAFRCGDDTALARSELPAPLFTRAHAQGFHQITRLPSAKKPQMRSRQPFDVRNAHFFFFRGM